MLRKESVAKSLAGLFAKYLARPRIQTLMKGLVFEECEGRAEKAPKLEVDVTEISKFSLLLASLISASRMTTVKAQPVIPVETGYMWFVIVYTLCVLLTGAWTGIACGRAPRRVTGKGSSKGSSSSSGPLLATDPNENDEGDARRPRGRGSHRIEPPVMSDMRQRFGGEPVIYVTPEGECWHKRRNCRGLGRALTVVARRRCRACG